MCSPSGIDFTKRALARKDIEGKRILEVGSHDINGNVKPYLEPLNPQKYLGVDITLGPGVDEICNANDIVDRYGPESFDAVVATELIEHTKDWKKVINNFKDIVTPNGIILITTRSYGFGYHGAPYDYWRFEEDDMKHIFSDFVIEQLEKDPRDPGIFIKAKKPPSFSRIDLTDYELYSVMTHKKISSTDKINLWLRLIYYLRKLIKNILPAFIKNIITRHLRKR